MSTAAWGIVAAAAACAGVAAPRARRSRLALAIAATGGCIVLAGLAFGALGYGGCSDRGDCGALGETLRLALITGMLVLPVLLLTASMSWLWRRLRPAGARPMRLRDRAGAVFGGLSLIVSIAILAGVGDASRIAGVICVLFSLAVLASPISALLPGMARGGPRLDRVDHDGVAAPAVVVDGSRGKLRLMRAALALFATTGVLMVVAPGALADVPGEEGRLRLIGIFCAAVFGIVLVISLFTRGRYRLALVPDGLRWEAGASPAFVAWDDLAGVSLVSFSGTQFLGVDLARPDALKTTSAQRRIARFSRPIARADTSITLEPFPVEPERLADAIVAYTEEPELRREIGTERSLARLTAY